MNASATTPDPSDLTRSATPAAGTGPGPPKQPGEDRDRTAEDRDERAVAHDEASDARDERAQARDERAETRERDADGVDAGAAADRAGALRDRRGGASDRTQAADDREAASADRIFSARERAAHLIDGLTQAHRREAGLLELEREMSRATRTAQPLTLCFVDVDDLKAMNDSRGHAAGDQLLRTVADSMRSHLRPYDLVVRYGGDEFLCALADMTATDAAERFALVNEQLAADEGASVTVGLAEIEPDDTPEDLIARADEALYVKREQRRSEQV